MIKSKYIAIGLMSGSSMDGLDICAVEFSYEREKWNYTILSAACQPLGDYWLQQLRYLPSASAIEILEADAAFGKWLGMQVNDYIIKNNIYNIDIIASHGHTLLHQPHRGFTLQIGAGADIAAITGITTVCNLRATDIALGGQGAPIVPIGDMLLFSSYQACLNIGGIANISIKQKERIIAYDICAANQILNFLTQKLGADYDKKGIWAREGVLIPQLLNEFLKLDFHHKNPPKSMANEWVRSQILNRLDEIKEMIDIKNYLHTYTEGIAICIADAINKYKAKQTLVSGGGAYNSYLISRIQSHTQHEIVIADDYTIQYKEALVMALIGVLRLRGEHNVLASVTGATTNSCGGELHRV